MENNIIQFLEFRKKFTKREWYELQHQVEARLNEKADQLELDDLDIKIVAERALRFIGTTKK